MPDEPLSERIARLGERLVDFLRDYYSNFRYYGTHPGWGHDDSDAPLALRDNRIIIDWGWAQRQGNNQPIFVGDVTGLIPQDIPVYTLEQGVLQIANPGRNLQEGADEQTRELVRTLADPQAARGLNLQIRYHFGDRMRAQILATYGEIIDQRILQGFLQTLEQSRDRGEITLRQRT